MNIINIDSECRFLILYFQDFSQFLFNWYMREKKQSCLIERCKEKGGEKLANLLNDHPSLVWLHDIASGHYQKASETLLELAHEEMQLLRRKKVFTLKLSHCYYNTIVL